jgi:hypothetical protein
MRVTKMWRLGVGKKSHSATDEPWKHPGQNSQDPDNQHPTPNVVEQEKQKKDAQWDKAKPSS